MIIMNTGNTGRAINSIDDAVQHCHEKAKILKDRAGKLKYTSEHCDTELLRNKAIEEIDRCLDCAADHEQLADWLEELKERREADRWISVSERLPDDLEPVNITWINHDPEPYYADIKDKPFTATGVYFNGQWYWWSTLCTDTLAEYSHNFDDVIDTAIEVIAWRPLPEYKESEANT